MTDAEPHPLSEAEFQALKRRVLDLERKVYGYVLATGEPLPADAPKPYWPT